MTCLAISTSTSSTSLLMKSIWRKHASTLWLLIDRQGRALRGQPHSAFDTEQVSHRWALLELSLQHRVNLVLLADLLAHQMRAS